MTRLTMWSAVALLPMALGCAPQSATVPKMPLENSARGTAAARSNSGQSATNSRSGGYQAESYGGQASQAKMHEGITRAPTNTMIGSSKAKSQTATSKAKKQGDEGDDNTNLIIDEAIVEECSLGDLHAYFPRNSAVINGGKVELQTLADCLSSGKLSGREIVLTGHTDPRGTASYNMKLGESRAEAVADLLAKAGVPRQQMMVQSMGEKGDSSNRLNWAFERRVDVELK